MRNKSVIYGKLTESRKFLREARQQGFAAIVRREEAAIAKLQANLRAIRQYGGEDKPMRTPWKRLLNGKGRKAYFEKL
jgi:hypothetical protein